MKKRFISIIIVIIMAAAVIVPAQAAGTATGNIKVSNTYTCGQFKDVEISDWFSMYVQAGYEYGLLSGKTGDTFAPFDKLTVGEAVKIAVCLSSIYNTGKADFNEGSPWYKSYEAYALKKGMLDEPFKDYATYITREQFAQLIAGALPEEALNAINDVPNGAVPDVLLSDSFGPSVYELYEAGVLAGSDRLGTFRPYGLLSRAEAAAMVARAADAGFRKSLNLSAKLSGEQIYEKCASAVFYLERYDMDGALMGIGSGFFISRDGLALTNYHVIDGAAKAIIMMADGTIYDVKGVCGFDKERDLAILQIDGSGFDYLRLGDSDVLTVGDRVYSIGSPFGMLNSLSDGIVSNAGQDVNDAEFIPFSAPISQGSGGGPVLDTRGQVVGVTCLTASHGQTLNFAVPINVAESLSRTGCVPLITLNFSGEGRTIFYAGYYPVPDYGVYVGTAPYKLETDAAREVKTYFYKTSEITKSDDIAVEGYISLLAEKGFAWQSSYTNDAGYTVNVYKNDEFGISIHFGLDSVDGVECRFVALY